MDYKKDCNNYTDIEAKSCISIILSIVSLAFSSLLMFPCLPRILSNEELQFDYIGAIVGILALLVTALIGVDIYKSISIENRMNKIVDEKLKDIKEECIVEIYKSSIVDAEAMILYYKENKKWHELMILKKLNVMRELDLKRRNPNYQIMMQGTLQLTEELINKSSEFDTNTYNEYVGYMGVFHELCAFSNKATEVYMKYRDKDREKHYETCQPSPQS